MEVHFGGVQQRERAKEREREREIERDLGGAATVDSDQVCLLYVLL